MAYKYGSLSEAMRAKKLTQQALAERVTRLKRKRLNGKRLKLSQSFVSELETGAKRAGVDLAEAIAEALDGEIDPAVLVFGSSRDAA